MTSSSPAWSWPPAGPRARATTTSSRMHGRRTASPARPAKFADRETMPHFWARQNFRKPEERVIGFSYAFLGVRLECAQCHKHPFDQWTQDDFNRFGAFFNAVGFGVAPDAREAFQQINKETGPRQAPGRRAEPQAPAAPPGRRGRPLAGGLRQPERPGRPGSPGAKQAGRPRPAGSSRPRSSAATRSTIAGIDDPRAPLMEWLRSKDNPYFARAFVNRVWANYFGVGIVNPPDDMNLANPPSNAALLDYLADGFVDHDFDMKWLHREITGEPGLPAELAGQRDQPARRAELQPGPDPPAPRRGPDRRRDPGHRRLARSWPRPSTEVATRAIGPGSPAPAGAGAGATTPPRSSAPRPARPTATATAPTSPTCSSRSTSRTTPSSTPPSTAPTAGSSRRPGPRPAPATRGRRRMGIDRGNLTAGLEGVPLAELERRLADARANNQAVRILRLETRIAEIKGDAQAGPARGRASPARARRPARREGRQDRPGRPRGDRPRGLPPDPLAGSPTDAEAEAAAELPRRRPTTAPRGSATCSGPCSIPRNSSPTTDPDPAVDSTDPLELPDRGD